VGAGQRLHKVRAAYRRTTFLDDRRRAMAEWSEFVGVVRLPLPPYAAISDSGQLATASTLEA